MTMHLSGPKTVKLADIKITTYVRLTLDQDHVLYLADLYDHGVAVEPIVVNDKMELVKGRHRMEAMLLVGLTECKALIAKSLSPSETLVEALTEDMKGTLPPSAQDVQFVIQQLMDLGLKNAEITDRLKRALPHTLVAKYIQVVFKRVERKKIAAVIGEILEGGLSVANAAKKYEITEPALREALGLRKKRAKLDLAPTYSAFETRVRGLSQQMTIATKEVINAYNEGDITEKQLSEFAQRIKDSTSRIRRTAVNIEERIETAKSNHGGS